jgi:hypothetical protein
MVVYINVTIVIDPSDIIPNSVGVVTAVSGFVTAVTVLFDP